MMSRALVPMGRMSRNGGLISIGRIVPNCVLRTDPPDEETVGLDEFGYGGKQRLISLRRRLPTRVTVAKPVRGG